MKNNLYLIIILNIFLLSCKEPEKKVKIIIKDQMVDTAFGLASYNVYCSDTSWHHMASFGDSLMQLYSKNIFTTVAFVYPESAVPVFKTNSYAIKKVSSDDYFIIARYYYTDTSKAPYLEKNPKAFELAMEKEKEKNNK